MVFGLPPSVKIYFATELCDMRNGIDGLRAVVEHALKKDPYEGHLFVFVGKALDEASFRIQIGQRRCSLSVASVVWRAPARHAASGRG